MRSSNKGFTLIEVLVAMTMFAVAFTGLASLMTGTMRANLLAVRMTEASTRGRDKIEEVRNQGVATACTNGSAGQFSWTCASAAGPMGTTEVTVATWWTGNASNPVILKTFVR
jgi:prepilin-type N-terminal cleavage/methylation domain-containing protein